MSHVFSLGIFFLHLPSHSLKSDNYGMKRKIFFQYMATQSCHIISKDEKGSEIAVLTYAHILKSHFGKMVELQCLASVNKGIPDAQTASWMCVLCCSL